MTAYARHCGATPTRAHARGGDAVAIGTYTGTDDTFTDLLEEFAQVDADQAEQDHGQLKEALSDGKIRSRPVSEPPGRTIEEVREWLGR